MPTTEPWLANLVDDDAGLVRILREARTVAVLGAKVQPAEPAHYVPAYLARQGYRVLPVNPMLAGIVIHGERVAPALGDLPGPVDVIDVFRRPEFLPGHAEEILTLPWRPAAVWFQLGIRNDAAAERLARAGIRVVQDRCMMPEHQRLWGAPTWPPTPPTRSSPPGGAGVLLDDAGGLGAPTWPPTPPTRSSPPGGAGVLLDDAGGLGAPTWPPCMLLRVTAASAGAPDGPGAM
jgi:hypothetical protein